MNGHVGAGIIILALAVFLLVMGLKGTQHQLFPQVFGEPTVQVSGVPGILGQQGQNPLPGSNVTPPDKNGNCTVSGAVNVGGYCVKLV